MAGQTHTRQVDLNNESLTGQVGQQMLDRSGILKANAQSDPLRILDNATGAGGLLFRFLQQTDRISTNERPKVERIVATDVNETVLSSIQKRLAYENRSPDLVESMTLDQQDLSVLADADFTHVFSNFGTFFAADDKAALAETVRVLKPGGTAGFTSWRDTVWPDQILFPALQAHLPDAPPLPHPKMLTAKGGWNEPEVVKGKLVDAGFEDVSVEVFDFTPDLAGDVEQWSSSLAMLCQMLAARAWTPEQNTQFGPQIQPAVIKYLHSNFEGGKWKGEMSSIVAVGRKPA